MGRIWATFQQVRDAFGSKALLTPAVAASHRRTVIHTQNSVIPLKRVVDFFHITQFGFPHQTFGFNALDSNLTVQFGVRFAYPDNTTESAVASALDSDDFSGRLDATQAGDPGATRGYVIGAGHFQGWFVLAVPISDTNG